MKRRDFLKGCLGTVALLGASGVAVTGTAQEEAAQEDTDKLMEELIAACDELTERANSYEEPDQANIAAYAYTLIYNGSLGTRLEISIQMQEAVPDENAFYSNTQRMLSYVGGHALPMSVGESAYVTYTFINEHYNDFVSNCSDY